MSCARIVKQALRHQAHVGVGAGNRAVSASLLSASTLTKRPPASSVCPIPAKLVQEVHHETLGNPPRHCRAASHRGCLHSRGDREEDGMRMSTATGR